MKEISILLLIIFIIQKARPTFIVAYIDDSPDNSTNSNSTSRSSTNNNILNFNDILNENKKYNRYQNQCPLRIVGGVDAEMTEVPYQVALKVKQGLFWITLCGGSLITMRFVITAAHCFVYQGSETLSSGYRVYAGSKIADIPSSSLVNWRKIKKFYKHKYYDDSILVNDMGIIELRQDFIESDVIRPIRLHSLEMDEDLKKDEQCLVSGYGESDDGKYAKNLKMVCVPVVTMAECKSYYDIDEYDEYDIKIMSTIFCAGSAGKDSCLGDSGGPIVCQGVLAGITSWGETCGEGPGAYTKILLYTDGSKVQFNGTTSIVSSYKLLWLLFLFFGYFIT